MSPRTFHALCALGLTTAALVATASTPPAVQSATAATPTYRAPLTVKQAVISTALVRGYDNRQVRCLVRLVTRENRAWSLTVKNRQSTASGLFQHLRSPSGVMLRDLPLSQQIDRGLRYIDGRYGTACAALTFHRKAGHY